MTRLAQRTVEQLDSLSSMALLPGRQHRGRRPRHERWAELHRRWARARGFGPRRRADRPRQVAELLPLLDPSRSSAASTCRRRHRQGACAPARRWRAHDGEARAPSATARSRASGRGRPRAGVQTHAGRSAPSTSSSRAGIWGPRWRGWRRSTSRSPRCSTSTPHRAAARARRRDARGRPPDPAPPGPRDVLPPATPTATAIGNYRHEPRLVEPEASAGGELRPRHALHARRLRARRARGRPSCCRRCATSSSRARFNGLMSFTPDGFPLLGEIAAVARPVAGRGDLGHALRRRGRALAELMTPRRRAARPARVRPAALRRPRHEPGLRAGARRPGLPRGLRRHPPAPAVRAGARPAHDAVLRAPGRRSARTSSRAPAGSARSGTRPTARCSTGDEVLPARRVGRAPLVADRRRPSTAPAASGSGSSTSRRSRKVEVRARARWPSCSGWRPTTSTSRSA